MSYKFQIDPPGAISGRQMLDLNSGGIRVGGDGPGMGVDWGVAQSTLYESQQGQYGNGVADWVLPNRTVTIGLILGADYVGDEETLRSELQQKVGLLKREGGVLLRQRAGGPAMYADIVNADLTIPDVYGEGGAVEPDVQFVLECLPDFYGDAITLDTITCAGLCDLVLNQSGNPAVIQGDYPGRCQIKVTDTSGHNQYGIAWAFRSRYRSTASTALLRYDATALGIGTGTPYSWGSGNPSYATDVVAYNVSTSFADDTVALKLASGALLSHVGTYQVWIRCEVSAGPVVLQMGASPSVTISDADEWMLVPLGVVRIDPVPWDLGLAASWSEIITAITPTAGVVLTVDQIWLQPLDEAAGVITGTDVPLFGPGGSGWLRHDGAWSLGSGSVVPMPNVTGDLVRIPPSGMESRLVELFLKSSTGEFANTSFGSFASFDDGIGTFTVQVSYRPCWLSRP